MTRARKIVELGMAARDAARIKVRQPLNGIAVPGEPLPDYVATIVRDELNVKAITFGAAEVTLDTDITEELKLEGLARELIRQVNDLRRRLGFNVEDRVHARYEANGMLARAIGRHEDYIKRETLALSLTAGREDGFAGDEMRVEGEFIWIGLKKS
jgi:isoleucyl-tRNA synthetase